MLDMLMLNNIQLIVFLSFQLSSGFSQSHVDSVWVSPGVTFSFFKRPVTGSQIPQHYLISDTILLLNTLLSPKGNGSVITSQ